MFDKNTTWSDDRHYTEIIATRVYLLLLTITIIILLIYTSVDIQNYNITVDRPSSATFEQLESNPLYSSTFECPCQNINIPYDQFISISPQFHQICTSDFIVSSPLWMDLIFLRKAALIYSYDDFRVFIVSHFRLLVSLCAFANDTVTHALELFLSSTFISRQVQSRQTVVTQANISLVQFRLSTSRTFLRTLDYVRHVTQGNAIVSSILSNWHFLSLDTTDSWASLWSEPRSYGSNNCSCGTSAICTSSASIDEWLVPGFLVGCYPYEALLQSTLECLYDVLCINKLKTMHYPSNITFRPLNHTLSVPEATVQSLLEMLTIVGWETSINYERYYTACAPTSCVYSIQKRANLLYIITTLIGLYGGLSVVLKLIVPFTVRVIRRMILHRRQRVQPLTSDAIVLK